MKMVIDGNAGAGTIQIGGFDYHTGDRATGEARDLHAGQCIGACLEYAARTARPLMIYIFSDGSLSSSGMIDNSTGGRGKGVWDRRQPVHCRLGNAGVSPNRRAGDADQRRRRAAQPDRLVQRPTVRSPPPATPAPTP